MGGAFIYAPLSRQVPLKRLINASIGMGVAGHAPTHAELMPDDLLTLDLGPETGGTIHSTDGDYR